MNSTATITQEDLSMQPGYCMNPFTPLFISGNPADGLPNDLYWLAKAVDEFGNKWDFQNNLEEVAHDIKTRVLAWYEIGLKAWKVKLYKAWEKKYSSFRDFCERSLGRTAGTINNWIRSARVVSQLIAAGFSRLPLSAAVAMELSKVADSAKHPTDEVKTLAEVWQELCDRYCDHEITLENVKNQMAQGFAEPLWKTMRLSREAWEAIRAKAAEAGMSPNRFLEQFFGGHPDPEPKENQTIPDPNSEEEEITLYPEDEDHPEAKEAIALTDDIVDFCLEKKLAIGNLLLERYSATCLGALTLTEGYDLKRHLETLPDD